jgi:hypothetical protein
MKIKNKPGSRWIGRTVYYCGDDSRPRIILHVERNSIDYVSFRLKYPNGSISDGNFVEWYSLEPYGKLLTLQDFE